MNRIDPERGSERRREIDRAKSVRIARVEEPTIRICMDDCSVELGGVFWGLTKKTVGVDKVTALWKLHDDSTLFEVREPGCEDRGWAMHHLREDGLHSLGGVLEMGKDGQRATVVQRRMDGEDYACLSPPFGAGKEVDLRM